MTYYINRYTGEVLTYVEMKQEAAEMYDLNDETNMLDYSEYYEKISD